MAKTWLGSVLEISFMLSEASFVCQIKNQDLTVGFCSSKWLLRGKWEFLSPSSETSLRLATFCMPLDYLYLVGVLECSNIVLELWYTTKQRGKKAH